MNDRPLEAEEQGLAAVVQTQRHLLVYDTGPAFPSGFNTGEAVLTNVFGTLNVAEAARAAGAERFVLISTDKAVSPTNVMGASKRAAELIVQALDQGDGFRATAVRFGNVLESSGSVVPLFREQIAHGGPVTVTDRNIIRYFMTIPEAAELVIQAGAMGQGGDVFVLDMGEPVKIVELARRHGVSVPRNEAVLAATRMANSPPSDPSTAGPMWVMFTSPPSRRFGPGFVWSPLAASRRRPGPGT
mgnify:CR=1 FL=1